MRAVDNGAWPIRTIPPGHHRLCLQSVVYGIRPEHLDIADDGFPATVAVVEPTGSETLVFLRFGESEIVAVFPDWHDFQPGETINLRPRAERAHLFDGATGMRI